MYMCVQLLQSCPALCIPMNCSPPGSSVHGILQARMLEWVAISSSRGSSWPRDWTRISCTGRRILSHCTTRDAIAQVPVNNQTSRQCSWWRHLLSCRIFQEVTERLWRLFGSQHCGKCRNCHREGIDTVSFSHKARGPQGGATLNWVLYLLPASGTDPLTLIECFDCLVNSECLTWGYGTYSTF